MNSLRTASIHSGSAVFLSFNHPSSFPQGSAHPAVFMLRRIHISPNTGCKTRKSSKYTRKGTDFCLRLFLLYPVAHFPWKIATWASFRPIWNACQRLTGGSRNALKLRIRKAYSSGCPLHAFPSFPHGRKYEHFRSTPYRAELPVSFCAELHRGPGASFIAKMHAKGADGLRETSA